MSIPKVIDDMLEYISDAMSRIFGANDDSYPASGTQPFEGEKSGRSRNKKS